MSIFELDRKLEKDSFLIDVFHEIQIRTINVLVTYGLFLYQLFRTLKIGMICNMGPKQSQA